MVRNLADARLVIFDWDGTIVDSEAHIVQSLQMTSGEMELPLLPYHQYRDVIGLGMPEVVAHLYPGLDIDVVRFRHCYTDSFSKSAVLGNRFFTGALELVQMLSLRGLFVAVATGKSRQGLAATLRENGLSEMFHCTRCADESKSKPNPTMLLEILDYLNVAATEAVMVGDSRYDMEMARNAGVASVGVSFGVHSAEELKRYEPLFVIDSFAELSRQFTSQ